MLEQINKTAAFIKEKIKEQPVIGIILGTGLGGLVNEIEIKESIPYKEIPGFPVSTVQGHSGKLIYGLLGGKKILAMQGRFHYYEGYTMKEVTFPVRVMKALGIEKLVLSNAAGGVNPGFEMGDLMLIKDHINLMPSNPLIGKNEDSLGPRFLDMSEAYDLSLIAKAKEIAAANNIEVQEGVYAALPGPCFETPAEYKYIHFVGGDAVGMSTVPEVIVARHGGMTCFAMSVITDLGVEGKIVEVSHEEVQEIANASEPKMTVIVRELVKEM